MTDLDARLERDLHRLGEEMIAAESLSDIDDVLAQIRQDDPTGVEKGSRGRPPVRALAVVAAAVVVVVALYAATAIRSDDPRGRVGTTDAADADADTNDGRGGLLSVPTAALDLPAWAESLGPGRHDLPSPPAPLASVEQSNQIFLVASESGLTAVGPSADDPAASASGAYLDYTTMAWRDATPPGLPWADILGAAWVGDDDAVVWSAQGVYRWSPSAGWSDLLPAPSALTSTLGYEPARAAVLVEERLIFWADGLSFDVDSDQWRSITPIPRVPARSTAAWDGVELVVMGMWEEDSPVAATDNHEIDFAYDPTTDAWRELPPSGLTPFSFSIARFGQNLVAVDFGMSAATYDRQTNRWRPLDSVPLEFSETDMHVIAAGPYLYASADGTAVLDATGRWTPVPRVGSAAVQGALLFDWIGGPSVYVPPPPTADGALPDPTVSYLRPWAISVPDAFTFVAAESEDDGARVTIRLAATDGGECTIGSTGGEVPSWWNADGPGVVDAGPVPSPPTPYPFRNLVARISLSGVVDDRVHAVIAEEPFSVAEIVCAASGSAARSGAATEEVRSILEGFAVPGS